MPAYLLHTLLLHLQTPPRITRGIIEHPTNLGEDYDDSGLHKLLRLNFWYFYIFGCSDIMLTDTM